MSARPRLAGLTEWRGSETSASGGAPSRTVYWALGDQAVVSGVNFATMVVLARAMGPDGFGVFSLIWLLSQLLNTLKNAFITAPMMTLGPKQGRDRDPEYLGSLLAFQTYLAAGGALFLGVAVIAASVVFGRHTEQASGLALGLVAVICAGQTQDFVRRVYFLTNNDAGAFLNDLVSYGAQIALLLALVAVGHITPVSALFVVAGTSAVAASLAFPFLRHAWSRRARVGAVATECVGFGKWIASAALLQWVSWSVFMYVAGWRLGTHAVGALRAGQNVMGVVNVPMIGLENTVPRAAAEKLRLEGRSGLAAYLRRVAFFGELALAPVAVAALAAPERIMGFVYGSRFSSDGWVLRWWALTHLVFFLEQPLRAGLRAMEHTRAILDAYLLASTFALVAALPLTMLLGLKGVALGTLVANLIAVTWLGFSLGGILGGTLSRESRGAEARAGEEGLLRDVTSDRNDDRGSRGHGGTR